MSITGNEKSRRFVPVTTTLFQLSLQGGKRKKKKRIYDKK